MMQPRHVLWRTEGKVGVITLDRPELQKIIIARELLK